MTMFTVVAGSVVSLLAVAPEVPQVAPALTRVEGRTVRDALGGGARTFRLESSLLHEVRDVYISTPESFDATDASRRYPVVIVLDGESLVAPVLAAASSLTASGQIPEAIIVGVPNTQRLRDLTPPGLSVSGSSLAEGGDRYLDFLERELLPALERDFKVGGPRVLLGHSSGGILTTWAAATRPAFRFALALDTPAHLGDGWLASRLAERAAGRESALRYASVEARFGWPDVYWTRVTDAAPASWMLHRERLEGETHESMTLLGAYLGLRRLFADYSIVAAPAAPAGSVIEYYAALTDAYGARMAPPRPLLRQVVEDFVMAGRGASADEALEQFVGAYGEPRDGGRLRAQVEGVLGRPEPDETVEGLLAMPFPEPAAVAPFLGEWVGTSWTRPEAPSRLALRLRVESGRVVGAVVTWPAGDTEVARPLEYLRVTDGGLAFGYLNGMRPRGVLMYESTRSGDVLEGRMRLAGMEFRMPDGRELPVTSFKLTRSR